MVRDTVALMKRDLVGSDVKASVNLHFIRVDDFGEREEGGELNGKTGFSGTSSAHDDEDFVFPAVARDGAVHTRPTRPCLRGDGGGRGSREKSKGRVLKFIIRVMRRVV